MNDKTVEFKVTYSLSPEQVDKLRKIVEVYNTKTGKSVSIEEHFNCLMNVASHHYITDRLDFFLNGFQLHLDDIKNR